MGKNKKGKSGKAAKLGAPDHFTGFKLAFLASYAALYQQCLDSKSVGAFYDKVTSDFIAKYGEEQPFNKDLAEDAPDPEVFGESGDEDITRPSEKEAAESAVLFTKLRTVSGNQSNIPCHFLIYIQKLGQWYRWKYKCPEALKADTSASTNPFTAALAAGIEKAPQKLTPMHLYFKLHYRTRIKDEYLRRYVVAKKAYDDATEEDLESGAVKKPIPLQFRIDAGREFWLLESTEFWEHIAQEAENAHLKQIAEWEETKKVPKTALQFHQ
jgi:hypothetical protein